MDLEQVIHVNMLIEEQQNNEKFIRELRLERVWN
jgi:hypothetical protein